MSTTLLLAALAFSAQDADTTVAGQGVAYRIEATLDESTDVLTGRARFEYTNNAAATLDTLWFHLHLNAFRPNSAWARRDLQFGNRRFTDLGPDEHAFERLRTVRVSDEEITPFYPGAPDSTVVAIPLPEPLRSGESVTVLMDWDSRLSTLPRRQGRRERHYDFAQWYPRIAVYDADGWQVQPLMPQGEFYGEFAAYDVTLDVADDQVIGGTGVPVQGDPGWADARAAGSPEPRYQRDAYDVQPAVPLQLLEGDAADGRKRVRWVARDVHHFAWSTSPDYIYEGGQWNGVAIHVLYQPGDTAWAGGVVVRRTADALAFLQDVFGPYPWPQLTNLHRIEGGGTEFPMMVMDGSASEGLIMHEVAHQYVHGILANNEWREGWLDEGFASFLTTWYFEQRGDDVRQGWRSNLEQIREIANAGATQPIALASAEFRDFGTYNAMTYTKPALVLRMLRDLMGDTSFRDGMRRYYRDNRLSHVREGDLIAAMELAWGRDLDWFFEQWIHTTDTLDYAVGELRVTSQREGVWTVEVEVLREGEIWMPVYLRVNGETRLLDSREARQVATFTLRDRPDEARLDPDEILLDVDPSNNSKRF
jgi:hypothetical protein